MITASLHCYMTETDIVLPAEDAALMQAGDVVKVSFMLPDAPEAFERFERTADGASVTLYRNTVWIQFKVLRREFFVMEWDTGAQTLTILAEPLTARAYEAVKMLQSYERREAA